MNSGADLKLAKKWPLRIKNRWFKRRDLILDDEGVLDERLKVGVIRWLDIKRAYRRGFGSADYICLEVYEGDSYISKRSMLIRLIWFLTRWSGLKRFSIITNGLNIDPDWLFDFIISEVMNRRAGNIERSKGA